VWILIAVGAGTCCSPLFVREFNTVELVVAWMAFVAAGYFQWFVVVPRIVGWVAARAADVTRLSRGRRLGQGVHDDASRR
jgi:hypothetical protein